MSETYAEYCSKRPGCVCCTCLYHQSSRCPHGHCYDDLRAQINPYDKAHPDKPPRTYWSKWKEDQAYWCRGGIFYQSHECDKYVEYDESKHIVKECLEAIVDVYQDVYISCSLVDEMGCEECMKRFNEELDNEEAEEVVEQKTCPYFNGICQDGRKPQIKCGDNFTLSYFGESKEDRDRHVSEVCKGQMDNCRAYLFRQLEKAGTGPRSDHSTDELQEMYLKMIGSEAMPKQTYWTKCGRQFEKNSTASVTGYTIDFEDSKNEECTSCPFKKEVTKGWPPVFDRWECRAGSKEPNHINEWRGNLDNKNSLDILSLDHNFLEEIIEYCNNQKPLLGASYNQDIDDCRQQISVHCEQNKKGIAAKKELIEKFFGEKESAPKSKDRCSGCSHNVDDGNHLAGHIYCDFKKRVMHKESEACAQFDPVAGSACDIPEEGEEHCETDESPMSSGSGSCASGSVMDTVTSTVDKPTAMTAVASSGEKGDEDMIVAQNGQCCVNCEHYSGDNETNYHCGQLEAYKNSYGIPKPQAQACSEFLNKKEKAILFDYSTVDDETATFLQEKANRITEIRIKSVVAIGKEFKEAQDKLSNNKTGTFQSWVKSLGFDPKTAYNYINGFNYIVENFHNIEDAENIQPSLLFAASKPSAPKELSEKVASGDITTHKQYKELEGKLKAAEQLIETERLFKDSNYKAYQDKSNEADKLKKEVERFKYDNTKISQTIQSLNQQLDQAKRNGDPAKVQELGKIISDKQQEIEGLRQQLHDKPIEVSATRVVEKRFIPDDIREAIYHKVDDLCRGLFKTTKLELKIFAEVGFDYLDEAIDDIRLVANRLETIRKEITVGRDEEEENSGPSGELKIDPTGSCGACTFADMDQLPEDQLNENKTWCTLEDKTVDIFHNCGRFERFGGRS